jgi:hypothetical protein
MMQSMVIQMNDRQLQTPAQLQAFLEGTSEVAFTLAAEERYGGSRTILIPVKKTIKNESE